jgi:hypothetical protein
LIAEQFIRKQTPVYVDIYYSESSANGLCIPSMCRMCHVPWTECQSKQCTNRFSTMRIFKSRLRKMVKIFLQNSGLSGDGRGLPVSEPFAARLGHTHFVLPEEARGGM